MENNCEVISVQVTFPDLESGKICANTLINEKLIACCNITSGISIYVWKEDLIEENEVILNMKSLKPLLSEIIDRIKQLHSYEVPAITCSTVLTTQEYYDWVQDSVKISG